VQDNQSQSFSATTNKKTYLTMSEEEFKQEEMMPVEETAPAGAVSMLSGAPDEEKGGEKPPPQGAKTPPPGAAPPKQPKKKREKNPDFQDVEKTGKWGSISRKEMIIMGVVVLAIIGGVIAAVVVLTGGSDDDAPAPTLPPKTAPPTPAPTFPPEVDPNLQIPVILEAVGANPFINSSLSELPTDAAFYQGKSEDTSASALVRAMSWSLYGDKREPEADSPWLVPRFVLAALYYSLNGEQWTDQSQWLSYEHACDWNGVFCDFLGEAVNEITLTNNNLAGTIPMELTMLPGLISFSVMSNQMTGIVPWDALGSMPNLSFLFMNDNKFNGTISGTVRANGVLCKLD
jgi:hypothetical protein